MQIKTIVELYDKEPVENVLSACVFEPQILVYICDISDNTLRKETAVYRILKSRGLKTKPRFYYIDTTNLAAIYRTLAAVVRDYPGCMFDFTGGKDLVLLAAGIFCKENNVPGYYIDVETRRFCPVFGCEELRAEFHLPRFRAEDVFALAGATMSGNGHFELSLINETFEEDVFAVWNIMMKNPDAWGGLVGYLQAVTRFTAEGELYVNAKQIIRVNEHVTAKCNIPILHRLEEGGLLLDVHQEGKHICFKYKTGLIKKCLLNHGIWLELYAYISAKRSGYFDDVRTSVLVDWDNVSTSGDTTRNEIDVLLVKGITPVFISCKMGQPTALALSEIKIISEKFGGIYTKTVLLTASDLKSKNNALYKRAQDLDIYVLDKQDLQTGMLEKSLLAIAER
ncbi:MAG: DUF1887 family CARF protein [Oscillospiraceae bacterium]